MISIDQKLISHWKRQGLRIAKGVADDDLRQFESNYELALPGDFQQYLRGVNGMLPLGGQDCDSEGFSFWQLADIRPMHEECSGSHVQVPNVESPESYFVFADYMQWSWAYAMELGETNNRVIAVGWLQAEAMVVASTFSEFVDLYISDDPAIYPRPSESP